MTSTDPAIHYATTIRAMLKQDFVAAIAHLRFLDAREGKWKYVHSQKNGIHRIEAVFQTTFDRDPWPKNWPSPARLRWENEVGYYCSRLGVAALIDDIHQAGAAGLQPRTLCYFLRSSNEHGQEQSSRWEMFIYAVMEQEWMEAKRQEVEAAREAQRKGAKSPLKVAPPQWVVKARETLRAIKAKPSPTPDEHRTVAKLEAVMSRMGFSLEG